MNLYLYNFHTRASLRKQACYLMTHLQLQGFWLAKQIFVNPGMMPPVIGWCHC